MSDTQQSTGNRIPRASPAAILWSASNLPRRTILGRLAFATIVLAALGISGISVTNASTWLNKPFPGFLLNARMLVQDSGLPHWTGLQARLNYPDKVLSANGIGLRSRVDLDGVVDAAKVGDPIAYTIERDQQIVMISIPTMKFSGFDFGMLYLIPFVSGLIYLALGIVVFVMKPDTNVSWAFLSVCCSLSLQTITSFGVASGHVGLLRLQILTQGLLPPALVHLALVFPTERRSVESHPWLQLVPYIASGPILAVYLWLYPAPPAVVCSQLLRIYLVIGVFALLSAILVAHLKDSSHLTRQRAKTVLWGATLAFPLPAFATTLQALEVPLKEFTLYDNWYPIPLILFPATIGYAIARHNLFDVDVYIKRTVGYLLMTAIVTMSYFSLQTVISTMVVKPHLGEGTEGVYPVLFALLVVFLFNPINRKVQDVVDRVFFRKRFDYKETIASVSNTFSSVLNREEIVKQVIEVVRRVMFIDSAGLILCEPQKRGCEAIFISEGAGNGKDQTREACIPANDPLLTLLSTEKRLITKYDIAEDPRYADLREPCGQRFSEMAASLAIPLIYQDRVKGVLALGYKKSGHFYTREDIDLLQTLMNEAAAAIENARLCEQMKKEETVRTNLARYLSPQIVDQIIQKDVKVNLGGDRKVVTVLFSDIRNFTTITESRPADQLVQILNEYFTEMAEIIFKNQGSLDKYIGDAIVAVFGSLIPLENSAPPAATAAIQMMERLPALNDRWIRDYGFTMNIGIGLNTGEVFLGNVGSPERMEFTVIGDTVNVASRLSGVAKPGQILLTRATQQSLGSDISCRELPPVQVKGKSEPLAVAEVVYA